MRLTIVLQNYILTNVLPTKTNVAFSDVLLRLTYIHPRPGLKKMSEAVPNNSDPGEDCDHLGHVIRTCSG